MNIQSAQRLVQAIREQCESVTLTAHVKKEAGVHVVENRGDEAWHFGGHTKLNLAINYVFFAGWPTEAENPDEFASAVVGLDHPVFSTLRDQPLTAMWNNISNLPRTICELAAKVIDGQRFKVRLPEPSKVDLVQHLTVEASPFKKDLKLLTIPHDFQLEAWNSNAVIPFGLPETFLGVIFSTGIVEHLRKVVSENEAH